jgi:two-component system KDP operon response regulator KdpE
MRDIQMKKKVLMIDDDPELGQLVETILKPLEITVHHAYSGEEGLKQAYVIHPDLVILDINMPGLDGFDVCARLREFSNFPILMLTARSDAKDLLRGFDVGVDDFLRKPFGRDEFEARVRALLRRSDYQSSGEPSYVAAYTDSVLIIDLSSKTVKLRGSLVELSTKEYNLLACLVREQGKALSHRKLAEDAWGERYINDPSELSLYIHYLRQKLKDGEHGHQYIRTLWGQGYWFAPRTGDETS